MNKKGILTIELSLLMPLILGVFIFLIFTSFYLHDRCIIEKSCYIGSLRGSECAIEGSRDKRAKEAIDEFIPDRLLGKWDLSHDINVTEETVEVTINGSMGGNSGLLCNLIPGRIYGFSTGSKAYILNESEYIRKNKKR